MLAEKLALKVDGDTISVQRFSPSGAGPWPVLCVSHGLPPGPRDPSDAGYQALAERFRSEGFCTLIFNFRGVGESEGDMDIRSWCCDLSAVLDATLAEGVDAARVSLLGFSAGAAVSVYVAANDQRVTAVAACACPARFTFLPTGERAEEFLAHLRRIGLIRSPGFPSSVEEWRAGFQRVSPLDWVGQISPRPLLLLHGDHDDLVPLRNAQMLFEEAGQPKELVVLPGAGHRIRHDPRAMDIVAAWLRKVNGLSHTGFRLSPE